MMFSPTIAALSMVTAARAGTIAASGSSSRSRPAVASRVMASCRDIRQLVYSNVARYRAQLPNSSPATPHPELRPGSLTVSPSPTTTPMNDAMNNRCP